MSSSQKPLKESVMELLFTGKYAVDWWEGDPRDDEDELDEKAFL